MDLSSLAKLAAEATLQSAGGDVATPSSIVGLRKPSAPLPIARFLALDGLLALAAASIHCRDGFCRPVVCNADLRSYGDEAARIFRFFVRSSLSNNGASICEFRAAFCHFLDTAAFQALPPLPALHVLTLDGCQEVEDTSLAALSKRCPSLTTFSLYWNVRVTDKGLGRLLRAQQGKNLVDLNFSGVKNLSDLTVQRVASQEHLEILDLTRCTQMSDAGLLCLCECLDKLRILRLYADAQLSPAAFGSLHRLHRLEELDLCGCRVEDDAMAKVVSTPSPSSCLHTLNLTWTPALTDVAAMAIARSCPKLKWLSLFGNLNITGASIEALAAGPCRNILQSIDVHGLAKAPEYSLHPEKLLELFPALVETELHH